MKKSLCIISFSPIYRDARVLRQIKFLSPHYDLTVIGYGPPHAAWSTCENVNWKSLSSRSPQPKEDNPPNNAGKIHAFRRRVLDALGRVTRIGRIPGIVKRVLSYAVITLGRLHPKFYELWYWRKKQHAEALEWALKSQCDAFHANDWEALPASVEAAQIRKAKVLFDAHEYAPLELENRWYWNFLFKPVVTYFLKKYASQVDAAVTVAPLIAERMKEEFQLETVVVLNAPERDSASFHKRGDSNQNTIHLIHHGAAIRDRKLEYMIEALVLCDERFRLDFLLVENDARYLLSLKRLAGKLAPGRISFYDPVPPEEIVRRISNYDMGFCLIAPTNYNYLVSLPNKFFDYIMAGLAVCVGPSPSMTTLVHEHGFGCVAPSFDPRDVANVLNQTTFEQLAKMRKSAQEAAKKLNAEKEMKKLIGLYGKLLAVPHHRFAD